MQTLSQRLDEVLIDLAWSLWTEIGVAGVSRRHQDFLILPEELIILTAMLAEKEPRLRDEALDWCTRYHQFISVSRLKTLAKSMGKFVEGPLSLFCATLNALTSQKWPILIPVSPLKIPPSGKSQMRDCERPAMLIFRLRSFFGVGARADLIAFFLAEKTAFSAADVTEIGYTKRNLSEILDSFVRAGIFEVTTVRNQRRYSFFMQEKFIKTLGELPKFMPAWRTWLELVLTLRDCVLQVEKKPDTIKCVEVRNALAELERHLQKLDQTPPQLSTDLQAYWKLFSEWLLEVAQALYTEIT